MQELHRQLVYDSITGEWVPMTQPQGGTGGTASNFNAAFPSIGTAAGFLNSAGTQMVPVQLTASGQLPTTGLTDAELRASAIDVNIVGGGGSGGTSSNFNAAFPTAGTAIGWLNSAGTNMVSVQLTAAGEVPVSAQYTNEQLDYDSGGGTVALTVFGVAIPGAGGPVAGGTVTNPFRVDPTGTTTQPISAVALPLPTGAALAANQQTDALTDAELRAAAVPVASSSETSTVYNGTTALTPKFAVIAAASSGNNTLVAAVTAKKIRVLAYNFISNGTVNAKFQSGAGGTDITGPKYCVANMGICANYNKVGWFETAAGALLNLNLSGAVGVGGELVYVEV